MVLDAAWRLGPRPVALTAWHRSFAGRWQAARRLAEPSERKLPPLPGGWFGAAPPPTPPALAPEASERLVAAATRASRDLGSPGGTDWHGPFPATALSLGMDLYGPGDIRPVWERSRLAALPLLAQAHRLAPAAGHRAAAEALLADWATANPAFRGPNWASGQEAALRALHILLALALLEVAPPPATAALLARHARRIGHQDGSAFADLALAGPADARASLERAARLFLGASAGIEAEPGCAWLGLAAPPPLAAPAAAWVSAGFRGVAAGGARAILRAGPLRFRPGHADLLHLDLWDGAVNLLRDGGTGAYNPPPEAAWWSDYFPGTAAHNTIGFDDADQMPRLSRFLFARWPRAGQMPGGGWLRDHRGNQHTRMVQPDGRHWLVLDQVAGRFRHLALRWRLAPGAWTARPDGVEGPLARLRITADGPLEISLESGWESPAYGQVEAAPVLVARARAPVARLLTRITLPDRPPPGAGG